jgi:hypothetical protein
MIVVPEEWAKRLKGRDIFDSLFAIDGKVCRNKEAGFFFGPFVTLW